MDNSLQVSASPGCPTVMVCSTYERAGQRRRRISYHSTEHLMCLTCGVVTLYPSRVCIQVRCSVGIHFSRVPCGTTQTPIVRVCVTLCPSRAATEFAGGLTHMRQCVHLCWGCRWGHFSSPMGTRQPCATRGAEWRMGRMPCSYSTMV